MQEQPSDERRLVKTRYPGIYKRGGSYVVTYRDPQGKQRKRFARTLGEARDLRATLRADVARGEYRALSRISFGDYAPEWLASYHGRTGHGIRASSLDEYRRELGLDHDGRPNGRGAIAYFGRMRLTEIEPRDIKRYAAELSDRGLAPASVKHALAPVRALLATAFEEGVIRSNPTAGLRFAQRTVADADEEQVKALAPAELRALLDELEPDWRLFVEFLSQTGLRIGEALALRWGDVDFARRRVKVSRRLYRGAYAPPKSRYGRRQVPLTRAMVRSLAQRWEREGRRGDEEPVFPSRAGTPLDPSNLMAAVLKPAAKRAGVSWTTFHTLRHTCATMLFNAGLNAKQVQIWLGHHSPAFTLATYVHLLADDLPSAEVLDSLISQTGPEGSARVHSATESESVASPG
jgi:integrase